MVCGHAQPQKTLPKMTVKRIIKTIKVSKPMATKWKSWGKNVTPQKINLRSITLNKNSGCPSISNHGKPNNNPNNSHEKYVRNL